MSKRRTNFYSLEAKVMEQGYCCMKGFLELSAARGETPVQTMSFLGMDRTTLYYHLKKLKNGKYLCRNNRTASGTVGEICLLPVIREIREEEANKRSETAADPGLGIHQTPPRNHGE